MDYYGNDKVYVGTWPWSFDFDWWKYRNRPKIEESSLEYITQYSEYITDVSIKKNTWTRATYGNKASWLQLNGVYPSYQDMLSGTKIENGRFFSQNEWDLQRRVIIVGGTVREGFFQGKDPIGKKIRLNNVTFEIIGELVAKINSETKKINTVDVGGGISPEKRNFTFEDYRNLIVKYFDTENLKFIFEPGRLIAANAGILVSKVLYTKNITGKKFVIIDAGMNDMMRPALYDAHHEIMPDVRTSEYDEINTDIVGPICESSDVFLNIQKFNKVKSGQYVILKDVGAYGSTMSSNYNARPLIEELMVDGSQIRIIRKTQSYEDFIKNEI